MSGFKQHITYGWFSHFLSTILLIPIAIYIQIPSELLLGLIGISLPITLFGSIVPDIDHPSSKTYRLFRYLLLLSTMIITSVIIEPYQTHISNIYLIFLDEIYYITIPLTIGIISLLSGITITVLFEKIRPPHRGLTHGFIFGLSISIILFSIVWLLFTPIISTQYNIISSAIITQYLFIGFCSHLYADDII